MSFLDQSSRGGLSYVGNIAGNALKKQQAGTTNSPTKRPRQIDKQPKLSRKSILATFKEFLQDEELILRFDLLSHNERCIELLRKVQRICIIDSLKDYQRLK